jgi:glutamine synthetase
MLKSIYNLYQNSVIMSREKVLDKVKNNSNPKVKLAVTDIDGVLRGKYIHKDKFASALDNGMGFCSVIFGWDSSDVTYDYVKHTGWHTGFHDDDAFIDLDTFRTVPWDNDVPFFLADFSDKDKSHPACPRSLLKKIKKQAKGMGYDALFGQEFEWFNFRETSESILDKQPSELKPLTPGMFGYSLLRMSENKDFFNDIYDLLNDFDVPIEGLHTETGPGVIEAAILFGDILQAADRAVLFKSAVKEIGVKYGIKPTFMAKLTADLPGCSGHIHQSLSDGKNNLFYDANEKNDMSKLMQSYLAGQLLCLPEILPMIAPTVNSYKRLVEGMWAPTKVNWAVDNRTVACRVINGSPKATRIEFRVPGSDANPYLAMAASLASGLYGIKNNLSLDQEAIKGNGYLDESAVKLSPTLWDATQKMKNSSIAKELFGEEFVEHFTSTREWEWKEYLKSVSDWEYQRYFEII